ncbi:hypothetical protein H9L15_00590 [Sphingomonas daechungensis]|uniref:Sel1 repeat family protein n=1 Tax=Sphingomonas daechungensis TaxID=1176646 RepID=A0ABX6T2E7_9SPHN|nr:hypothetical protein [Sphingomonas daechungensis]QNP43393.1 hypothetical protein H9L15_00590 [Sphingomonas daechungensis]
MLANDRGSVDGMIYKGRALLAKAGADKKVDPKLIATAREWFLQASSADPQDPEPLFEYFRTYAVAEEARARGRSKLSTEHPFSCRKTRACA